jgi:hypothetical protein
MASNTNTAKGRLRVTYVEEATVVKALDAMARESGLTLSDLLRQATWAYIKANKSEDAPLIRRDKERRK